MLRAQPLAHAAEVVVVGGIAHAETIAAQLAEIGAPAAVLLEPEGRDTAAAIAAAAAWAFSRDAEARMVVLPADHHIPDAAAFQAAVRAALAIASEGAIVTLGVQATISSSALGYIQPGDGAGAAKPIARFVEKPDAAQAQELIAGGALWNSGLFVATARTLLEELRRWAAPVAAAAERAVAGAEPRPEGFHLGEAFSQAPRIAFDRAVMERTGRGMVLPVDFAWSDMGVWAEVLAAGPLDASGNNLGAGVTASGASQVLGRAAPGMRVAVIGASRLVVVAEPDAVLVCGLDATQSVREAVDGCAAPRYLSLREAAGDLDLWLRTAALPLWATVGRDADSGAFREALTLRGAVFDPYRRTRVQARQTFVFASAAAAGIPGPWLAAARGGAGFLHGQARRPDGLYASRVSLAGDPSEAASLYDHAFVLLALSALSRAGDPEAEAEALDLFRRLHDFRHATGFREAGEHPYQANAQMHLLEAALAWETAGAAPAWAALSDEIADLALTRLIDPVDGALREFFDAAWRPLTGDAGRIEPGHQFEWAWLLTHWGRRRGDDRGEAAARRLFQIGRSGFDPRRDVVVNALWDDLSIRDAAARLWPQTEHLKAALLLGETDAALAAANGLASFLDTPARGVWCERMSPGGRFLAEPAPATSLYHLYVAVMELGEAACGDGASLAVAASSTSG